MTEERRTSTEAHVRRLWRHRGTTAPSPRRGPRQQLNLDQILEAGIEIADREGLAAVSTRAVAARFGRTAMALYPYVGSKENLLALMQDHASAMPRWTDPTSSLAEALEAWALALFELYLAHPWLTELPWSRSPGGPNEQDWLERLLTVLDRWDVPAHLRPPAVTMLYATVRATAQTAAAYRRMSPEAVAEWQDERRIRAELLPDLAERYPRTAALQEAGAHGHWQQAPRNALISSIRVIATGLRAPQDSEDAPVRRERPAER